MSILVSGELMQHTYSMFLKYIGLLKFGDYYLMEQINYYSVFIVNLDYQYPGSIYETAYLVFFTVYAFSAAEYGG